MNNEIFQERFAHPGCETWGRLARVLAEEVVGPFFPKLVSEVANMIDTMKFIPAGRYLYYAGRPLKYFNNCYALLPKEDTREEMALTEYRVSQITLAGGGAGVNYSCFRPKGKKLSRSGGLAGGPIGLMQGINDANRFHMQGGARRAALLGTLDYIHEDIPEFLHVKDWHKIRIPGTDKTLADAKREDFSFPAPLDFTNISVNYDQEWLRNPYTENFLDHVSQAITTGEPGFFFNLDDQIGRNPCGEMITRRSNDVCNLGSLNLAAISSLKDFKRCVQLGTLFLLCGSKISDLPYEEARIVRESSRRIGLGILGFHEWLLRRNYPYSVPEELVGWLEAYKKQSDKAARVYSELLGISYPEGIRAIAPTGTIGILAETTTGIEPLFAVAYKLTWYNGSWQETKKVDMVAQKLIKDGIPIESIETAYSLSEDVERRMSVQAELQKYVDQGISSTINLPSGDKDVRKYADLIVKYLPKLRGITFYPDGARGGQPLQAIPYEEALEKQSNDICSISGKGGNCGS